MVVKKTKSPKKRVVRVKATNKTGKTKASGSRSSRTATAKARGRSAKDTRARFLKSAPYLSFVSSALDVDKVMLTKQHWSRQLLQASSPFARALRAAPSPSPENNVVGVGVGEQISGGKHTGRLALKFLVRVKYRDDQLTPSDKLPESVDGLPTDIDQVGTFRSFQNPRTLIRPAPPGCSVGFEDPGQAMAGTFGALVKRGARRFVLSNNHVLANENRLPIGAPTFQQGFLDAGAPPPNGPIGKLSAFAELRTGEPNLVDCAISEVDDVGLVTNAIMKIGVPSGVTAAQSNMIVHKFGRTTDFTVGFVDNTMMDVRVDYDLGELTFEDQIIIKGLNGEAFSAKGDSGALIVERNTSRAIGLLFAGSASHTIANHIGDVFQTLNVSLA